MHVDLRLERALERVELVTGVGTRDAGRMCVMSLVACLAGEEHGDSPSCASPLIRAYAIPLNDNMPHGVRQRLKAFAPRIIGTRDALDGQRAALLRNALQHEVVPALGGLRGGARRFGGPLWRLFAMLGLRRAEREAEWMMERAAALADGADSARAVAAAGAVGRLVARAAREAPTPQDAERMWDVAIGLLDGLCEIAERPAAVPAGCADRLEAVFAARPALSSPRC